jgi:hypothetical protein
VWEYVAGLATVIIGIVCFFFGAGKWRTPGNDTGGPADRGVDTKLGESGSLGKRNAEEELTATDAVDDSIGIVSSNDVLLDEAKRITLRNSAIARELRRRHTEDPLNGSD